MMRGGGGLYGRPRPCSTCADREETYPTPTPDGRATIKAPSHPNHLPRPYGKLKIFLSLTPPGHPQRASLLCLRYRLAHRFNQHLCHLWTRELAGGNFARLQHLAHFGATECNMMLTAMRAGLRRGHRVARAAEEGMIEEHRRNAKFGGIEFCEDVMRIVCAVVVAHPGMVAPDDEIGQFIAALDIALAADIDGTLHVDFDEVPDMVTRPGARFAVRRDGRGDTRHVVASEQAAHKGDTLDVGIAVFFAEAQSFAEVGAHDIAVEYFDIAPARLETVFDDLGERAFARS